LGRINIENLATDIPDDSEFSLNRNSAEQPQQGRDSQKVLNLIKKREPLKQENLPDLNPYQSPASNDSTSRALKLIDYLTELTRLRSKIVRDINEFRSVLWLHEIPQDRNHCFARGLGPNEEHDKDIWIEIAKYDEPVLDEVPDICKKWVNYSTLYNTEDLPELLSSIVIQIPSKDPDARPDDLHEKNPVLVTKTFKLEDYPKIMEAWDGFVETRWVSWADLHLKWQEVQNVYSKLFSIYQEQQKCGEKYDLVMGFGFLTWKTPTGHRVRRHLVTTHATLSFEADLGKFTVAPAIDRPQLSTELDMLDIQQRPFNVGQKINEELLLAEDDPWDRSTIDPALFALANLISKQGDGEYHPKNFKSQENNVNARPNVDYAPALILRKRSSRGLEQTLKGIRDQIEAGGSAPAIFKDLYEEEIIQKSSSQEKSHIPKDPTIYFPKPSNKEQRKILEKLEISSGVLVQGPPGTGKSHTIANLISHLLATGQRVLVTAKTPRALQVLHDKLPTDLKPLCLNLIGNGVEEQKSLETSVSGLLAKRDAWNEERAIEKSEMLTNSIRQAKSEKAEIEYQLRAIREKDTFQHSIIDGSYSGTAAKIALDIRKESEYYSWFKDKIRLNDKIPLTSEEILKLRSTFCDFTPEMYAEAQMEVPKPGIDLPTLDTFKDLISHYFETKSRLSSKKQLVASPLGRILEKTALTNVQNIIGSTSDLMVAIESIVGRSMPWIKESVCDMLTDNGGSWKELLSVLSETLEGLQERARKIDIQSVTISNKFDKGKLLQDAKMLKKHFDAGGKIGWGLFKPKPIREHRYIIEEVKINNHPCNSIECLEMLIEHLEVEQSVEYAWKLWEEKNPKNTGPIFMQVAELQGLEEVLRGVVGLEKYLQIAKSSIDSIQGISVQTLHDLVEIKRLIGTCQAIISKDNYDKAENLMNNHIIKINSFANRPNTHPVAKKALAAFKQGKAEGYEKILFEIAYIQKASETSRWAKNTLEKLSSVAPVLAHELSGNPEDPIWEKRLENLDKAWSWKRANAWLYQFVNEGELGSLGRRLTQLEDRIRRDISELASIKAFGAFFTKTDNSHERHLVGWQQAINKRGKGFGRHAVTYRRNAQKHLSKCTGVVPAWIMPLHRVYETVKPEPGIFDVIIVDEASQCGPEALPLTYLAKRLIVVGDEHQISPEAVAVEKDQVFSLMNEHLNAFDHADSFEPSSSLFDHAKRRFGNRIVLREHFRCMPEIIRFSNDLFYSATPLIPLRQYPPERLEPLKCVHVPKGYREGSNVKAINRPEAGALVEAVMQCCSDDRYENKTMGVIVLQGYAQAELIESMLLERLGAEKMHQRRLICGNPYSFQGDERHVIFLSMVAAKEGIGSLAGQAAQRRFNVAASRAQDQMWLFHTATRNDLGQSCIRRKLLEFFEEPHTVVIPGIDKDIKDLQIKAKTANRQVEKAPKPFESWFELDVALRIVSRGFRVVPQYPVIDNMRIDLVVEGTKTRLAVECDGDYWHGADQYGEDMERQRRLERCGWHFHRIRGCLFNANPEKELEKLWQVLESRGIRPVTKISNSEEIEENDSEQIDHQHHKQAVFNFLNAEMSQKTETPISERQTNNDQGLQNSSRPKNIQEALSMKPAQLKTIIIDILAARPNKSCVKDALPRLVLKNLQLISRGRPRDQFRRKINKSLKYLESKAVIRIYQCKNIRVKLN